MARSEVETQRLQERIRLCETRIRELARATDQASQDELRQQQQMKERLEAEMQNG
jgi:hypothetical protein